MCHKNNTCDVTGLPSTKPPLMPTGLHCLLVCGIDYWWKEIVTCGRPGMESSVTEARSHDKGRGGRNVTGVHRSVAGKGQSVTREMEKQ